MKTLELAEFREAPSANNVLLIVPQGVSKRLTEPQQHQIIQYLRSGGGVVADGDQGWLEQIGFKFAGAPVRVSSVTDPRHSKIKLTWRPEEPIARFTVPDNARMLMVENGSGQPVALAGSFGPGRFVYLAASLDSYTNEGTSHYPFFSSISARRSERRVLGAEVVWRCTSIPIIGWGRTSIRWQPNGTIPGSARFMWRHGYSTGLFPLPTTTSFAPATTTESLYTLGSCSPW